MGNRAWRWQREGEACEALALVEVSGQGRPEWPKRAPEELRDPASGLVRVVEHVFPVQAENAVPGGSCPIQPLLILQILRTIRAMLLAVVLNDESPPTVDHIESSDPPARLVVEVHLQLEVVQPVACHEQPSEGFHAGFGADAREAQRRPEAHGAPAGVGTGRVPELRQGGDPAPATILRDVNEMVGRDDKFRKGEESRRLLEREGWRHDPEPVPIDPGFERARNRMPDEACASRSLTLLSHGDMEFGCAANGASEQDQGRCVTERCVRLPEEWQEVLCGLPDEIVQCCRWCGIRVEPVDTAEWLPETSMPQCLGSEPERSCVSAQERTLGEVRGDRAKCMGHLPSVEIRKGCDAALR